VSLAQLVDAPDGLRVRLSLSRPRLLPVQLVQPAGQRGGQLRARCGSLKGCGGVVRRRVELVSRLHSPRAWSVSARTRAGA